MPRSIVLGLVLAAALALVPVVLIARARAVRSESPRILLISDMANQPKFKAQDANPLFADGRAMRSRLPGTVGRADLETDRHRYRGKQGDAWAVDFPMPVTGVLIRRGRERYNLFCAPCHGLVGDGNGIVSKRAEELETAGWVPPVSFHTGLIRQRPVGHLFNTVTNGIRSMPSYGEQIRAEDRWAVVAYVRALERSQNATIEDVPPGMRPALE